MITYVTNKLFLCVTVDDVPYTINSTHEHFITIKEMLINHEFDKEKILELVNEKTSITRKFEKEGIKDIEIIGNNILYKGDILDNSLVNQIIETKNAGYSFENLVKFLENLMQNTSESVRIELYDWMKSSEMISITEDGGFLAYKKVTHDYLDIYTESIDNSIGAIPKMEKSAVDDIRENTCSPGLHFCSYGYLDHYGWGNDYRVMIVKIFPQDVISIPIDYSFQKGRCCKYEVIGEVQDWENNNVLKKPVDDYSELDNVRKETNDQIFNNYVESFSISQMCKLWNLYVEQCEEGLTKLVKFGSRSYAIKRIKRIADEDINLFIELAEKIGESK